MKKTLQKWGGRIALVVCLAFGFNMVADAQVPSIPRKQQTTKKRSTTRSTTNVAWGNDFEKQWNAAGIKKRFTIAVYCRSGRRSKAAAEFLVKQGYNVIELEGGIMAWQKAGKPVEK